MKAAEIRALNEKYLEALEKAKNPTMNVVNGVSQGVAIVAQLEIAAQLAELNERLTSIITYKEERHDGKFVILGYLRAAP